MIITGGEQAERIPTREEYLFLQEVYSILKMLAAQSGLVYVRCSSETFKRHLEWDALIAGPWLWDINESVPRGRVHLLTQGKERIGEMTVSDLIIH